FALRLIFAKTAGGYMESIPSLVDMLKLREYAAAWPGCWTAASFIRALFRSRVLPGPSSPAGIARRRLVSN
ncbi:MAG TPA: hypothetical protein PLX39_13070, partial [Pyrinomonadaceae bacterium]|nr:hypothetical protein [Pyrinomonadaceae bacterium]